MENKQTMIEVQDLCKSFHKLEVLKHISTTFYKNEVVSIIGPSGGGKSTFLRCLNLLEKPTSGKIIFDGTDICDKRQNRNIDLHRQKMGMVFQQFNLFNNMDVMRNLTVAPMRIKKMPKDEAESKAIELLKKVGLADRVSAYPSQLSGGQKQRVAIAGVIAMRPDCLVLDEATAMLDPHGRSQVMRTIHQLREAGISIVSITHYMEEAAQADRVLVMSRGRIVMEGTPEEVFSQTQRLHSYHLDVPQAAELRDELVKIGIPMPENVITPDRCAEELYKLLQ